MRVLETQYQEREKGSGEYLPHESPSSLISTFLILACVSSPSSASRGRFLVGVSVAVALLSEGIRGAASGADSTFSIGAVVLGLVFAAEV